MNGVGHSMELALAKAVMVTCAVILAVIVLTGVLIYQMGRLSREGTARQNHFYLFGAYFFATIGVCAAVGSIVAFFLLPVILLAHIFAVRKSLRAERASATNRT